MIDIAYRQSHNDWHRNQFVQIPSESPCILSDDDRSRWFTEEVLPHEPALRSYLRALFPLLPDIDDLIQESYARVLRANEKRPIRYAQAFLFTTARNLALDFFRRRQVLAIDGVADLAALHVVEEGTDVADFVSKRQELELLANAVRALPERCRQVLTLRLLYEFSHKRIAAELRLSEHTVKAQLAKGMRRCADYLERQGLDTKYSVSRRGEAQ